jgi:NAD-dependent deacetylase
MLPEEEWNASVRAAEDSELFFSIGTSAAVYPAASLPVVAQSHGAYLVEINPEPTPLTERADEFLQGPAGRILPALVEALHEARKAST